MKRRIAVVTTSRADYSHLYWPLKTLANHPEIDLGVIALGAHLSPEFGNTIREIRKDEFPIVASIECLLSSDTDTGMAKTIGLATLSLADLLSNWRPDILLLIADRYEMLAPASVALALRIPIAHIEGGEISQGAIDDSVRNALTKLAHIHFTSTVTARKRVISMGEEPWRVHHAGAPSIDHLTRSKLFSREELQQRLDLDLSKSTVLVAYHPVTIVKDTTNEAASLFQALAELTHQIIFVYPNSDSGSYNLIDRTNRFVNSHLNARVFINLDAITYWSLMKCVDILIGNSSSGIMETASYQLPTVNIGMRQRGREQPRNVLNASPDTDSILSSISIAMSPGFKQGLNGMTNPYGDGHASERITAILSSVKLDNILIKQPAPIHDFEEPCN